MPMRRHVPAILCLAAAAVLGACDRAAGPPRVAVVLPLSGGEAAGARSLANGATLAFEELAARHQAGEYPHPLQPVVEDSAGDPERAGEALARLFADGAVAAVGGAGDAEALALAAVAAEAKRPLVVPAAGTARLTGLSRYVFRTCPTAVEEARRMGSFAALQLGLRRAAVVAAGTPEAVAAPVEAFGSQVEAAGGEVLSVETIAAPPQAAFALERVAAARPQAVWVLADASQVADLVSGLRGAGFRGKVLTTSAFAAPEVLAAAGAAAEGVLVSRPLFDPESPDPLVAAFAAAYQERFGEPPTLRAAWAYDSVQALAAAMAEQGTAPQEAWKGLQALREMPGVTGHLQFDERGDAAAFPRVFEVAGGELTEVRSDRLASLGAGGDRRGG